MTPYKPSSKTTNSAAERLVASASGNCSSKRVTAVGNDLTTIKMVADFDNSAASLKHVVKSSNVCGANGDSPTVSNLRAFFHNQTWWALNTDSMQTQDHCQDTNKFSQWLSFQNWFGSSRFAKYCQAQFQSTGSDTSYHKQLPSGSWLAKCFWPQSTYCQLLANQLSWKWLINQDYCNHY